MFTVVNPDTNYITIVEGHWCEELQKHSQKQVQASNTGMERQDNCPLRITYLLYSNRLPVLLVLQVL